MRELEVRLALVCFGGSSLAVYMNGVSHEVLKLVRASKVYHSLSSEEKADPSIQYSDRAPDRGYTCDTESHYFDLLRMVGDKVDLHVIVDVISGASAGGINGIFLARAIAFDLDFDPLRDMWMKLGDIEELMERETLADRWSKIYMYPLIWLFGRRIWKGEQPYAEAKRKLSRFIRSRWFEPPFSGKRMLEWMIDANHNMGEAKPGSSLLPTGHRLDLFVSLTNFYGQNRAVGMHDPEMISEKQHTVSLNFTHMQGRRSARYTDFDDTNIPGLGFAARATSSFPGAFPPMRLSDLKAYLKDCSADWPHENEFMARNFDQLSEEPEKIENMSFIDGGVTNNKPFANAINAVIDRPAHREVDRRIVFVDPRPGEPISPGETPSDHTNSQPRPGFFRTILSSLAEIPRDEPILGDLQDIEEKNRQARRFETVLKRIERDVAQLVDKILILAPGQTVSTAMLASWRERAHEQARHEAGFGYGSYAESKAVHSIERISKFLMAWQQSRHKDHKVSSQNTVPTLEQLTLWAREQGYIESGDEGCRQVIPFFRKYDVDYRVRRMRFLIKRLNRQLQRYPATESQASFANLKAHIYDSIARYRQRWQPSFYESAPLAGDTAELMEIVAKQMALEDLDFEEDEMLAKAINAIDDEATRKTLFHAYVGFSFYDVLTLPMTAHTDLMEIDEIRVDRISPIDCHEPTCQGDGQESSQEDKVKNGQELMGAKLFNFGAFFSRRARENDYIWGRIHAANRLVDFITDAAGMPGLESKINASELRRKLALSIIDAEAKHTLESEDLIARLRKAYAPKAD